MNLIDLTLSQLKRAASIKEHIEKLTKELRGILGLSTNSGGASAKSPTMKIAANSKGEMGKAATCQVRDPFSTTRCKGQEEDDESSS